MTNMFLWEIRKNVKKGAIIGVSVAAVVMLILIAAVYNLLFDLVKNIDISELEAVEGAGAPIEVPKEEEGNKGYYVSEEELDALLTVSRQQLKEAEEAYEKEKSASGYATVFQLKNTVALAEYAKKHGLYNKEVRLLGINYDGEMNAENFLEMYMGVLGLIVAVFGIVLAANAYPNEYKSGTIKLLMTRPILKNGLTAAKLFALYAVVAVSFFLPLLIAYIYGAIAFGSDGTTSVVYGFNAMSGGTTTTGALTFGAIMAKFLSIIVVTTVSFSLATLTRNSVAGLIPSLIIVLNLGGFLNTIGVTAFLLSNATDFSPFFGQTTVAYHGNFFLSFAIVIFWLTAALVSTFVVTKKRDVY